MKKTIKIVIASLFLAFFAFSPQLNNEALAITDCGSRDLRYDPNTRLCIPRGADSDITVNELILRIVNFLLGVAAVVAILFIVIGGFRYIMSAGNEEQAQKGKKTLINAVIGLVIVILSYAIVSVVAQTVSCEGRGPLGRIICRI